MTKKSPTLNFGMHKGKTLKEVPLKYLGWLLTKYTGTLSKEDIEAEAISRGCSQRNGKWGYSRPIKDSPWEFGGECEYQNDFLGNTIIRTYREDDIEQGEDSYTYEGIPNTY